MPGKGDLLVLMGIRYDFYVYTLIRVDLSTYFNKLAKRVQQLTNEKKITRHEFYSRESSLLFALVYIVAKTLLNKDLSCVTGICGSNWYQWLSRPQSECHLHTHTKGSVIMSSSCIRQFNQENVGIRKRLTWLLFSAPQGFSSPLPSQLSSMRTRIFTFSSLSLFWYLKLGEKSELMLTVICSQCEEHSSPNRSSAPWPRMDQQCLKSSAKVNRSG